VEFIRIVIQFVNTPSPDGNITDKEKQKAPMKALFGYQTRRG